MIAIINVSKKYSKTNWQKYQVKINKKNICEFKHKASDGLAICLKKAADAVSEYQLYGRSFHSLIIDDEIMFPKKEN